MDLLLCVVCVCALFLSLPYKTLTKDTRGGLAVVLHNTKRDLLFHIATLNDI